MLFTDDEFEASEKTSSDWKPAAVGIGIIASLALLLSVAGIAVFIVLTVAKRRRKTEGYSTIVVECINASLT